MRKVLCSACGLMNLDRFVTFPHCAGCGTRLPEVAPPSVFDFWRRPLVAPMWATIIGLGCVGLAMVGVSISRETRRVEERQLVVYTQFPRQLQVGEHSAVQLALDTTEADDNISVRRFDNVQVRLPRLVLDNFILGSISPRPDERRDSGSGEYLIFNQLGREESIRIGLRPRRVGQQRISLSLYVRDFSPFEVRGLISVVRPLGTKVPN